MPLVLLLVFSFLAVETSIAQTASSPSQLSDAERADFVSPPNAPTDVEIGVYLIRVTSIDPPSEPGRAFEAEILLDLRWSDPRLGSEMALIAQRAGVLQDEEAEELLDRIWWPDIYVTNEIGARQTEQLEVTLGQNGTVEYLERFHVRVAADFDLHRFPFDQQLLTIRFESFEWDERSLLFHELPERIGYNEDEWIPGWTLTDSGFEIRSRREIRSGTNFSSATLEIAAARQATYYVWNTIAPFVLIMMLSWSVFWLTETATHERILISFIALLTIAGFHGNVASQLPHLDYWTVMDWVLALSYLLASGALIENVWVNEWRKRHDVHHAHTVDRTARWAFPGVFLVGSLAIWMFVYR